MPAYTTVRTFIEALRTGETNITRCLENVANDRALLQQHAEDIRTPGRFHPQFPNWARTTLRQRGMILDELRHIEDWPADQKEIVREQLALSIDSRRRLTFRWELTSDPEPRTEVDDADTPNPRVRFRSPRRGIELTSSLNLGDIRVAR